jgi:hypothetical protein
MTTDSGPKVKHSLVEKLYTIFMRLMAVFCFYYGLRYWVQVIGFGGEGSIRFDLMDVPLRTVSTLLAVLYPITSLGLWMGASWGLVLWVAAAGGEILMHVVWADIYGYNGMLVLSHLSASGLYALFQIALFIERRLKQRVINDSL